ncbi:MAG: EAL domain-containing protein [Thermosynechococcaceae cyanobacterium]
MNHDQKSEGRSVLNADVAAMEQSYAQSVPPSVVSESASPAEQPSEPDLQGETQGQILIVDDRPDNLRLLHAMLTQAGYDVRRAINGATALMGVRAILPDLILLDINMPDMDGYEVCRQLKQDPGTRDIPVIFLSALDEGLDKVKAFSAGGVDYVTKPFEVMEVLARIENHLQLRRAMAQVEHLNTKLEDRVLERTSQLQAAKHDLEQEAIERRKAQDRLAHMAWHDHLTDLPNRAWFMKVLQQALQRAQQDASYRFAVLFLDCDRFKIVNDSLGHLMGDKLLVQFAQRLTTCVPATTTLARFGGDEFTLLLKNTADAEGAIALVQILLEALTQPFFIDQQELFIGASVGIVMGSSAYEEPEALLRDADIAMYKAKTLWQKRYQVFDAGMRQQVQSQLRLETDLRRAIERQEFLVHYQPIISLDTFNITGFEALVRWQHPERGMIAPGEFIPIAEETSLVIPIGLWVLKESCRQLVDWQGLHGQVTPLKMSVNLSVKQFAQPDLIEHIDRFLAQIQLPSHLLTLEITESALMDNPDVASQMLNALRDRNIQLAIDDFGTGYSSLSYLHQFPVDILKVDRSFINRIDDQGNGLRIVEATIAMAQSLGMRVVAEGVETQEQAVRLQQMGCEYAQGYLFSRPLPSEAAGELILQPPAILSQLQP